MSKDNENVPSGLFFPDGPAAEAIPRFTPDQMVICESCLRANPPTRLQCLYCGNQLPVNNAAIDLQKPDLRPLENWEQGYNNILTSLAATNVSDDALASAADLLKLEREVFARLLAANHAVPVARTGTRDEATLIQRRLSPLGIDTDIVADVNLAVEGGPYRVRAAELNDGGVKLYERRGATPLKLSWKEIQLLVAGRLTGQRVESREENARGRENRILEANEFFTDETIVDFYTSDPKPFRILSKSFDFSCLGSNKGLLAEANMSRLLEVFRENARDAAWDDSYNALRGALEPVWPLQRNEQSAGWRRDRPGKLTKGNVTEISNEGQFQKYSSLCYWLRTRANS